MHRGIWLVIIGGLLIAGITFAVLKVMRPKSHQLKGYVPFRIVFTRSNLSPELENPVLTIKAKRTGDLIVTLSWLAIAVCVALLLINEPQPRLYLLLGGSLLGALYYFQLTTRQIIIYQNAIVFKSLRETKVYYLHEIEALESYNIAKSFDTGRASGYQIIQNGEAVCQFNLLHYHNLSAIENAFLPEDFTLKSTTLAP